MKHLHIISRPTARRAGLRNYVSNNPCKREHYSERRVSNGDCIECKSEQYQENKDEMSQRAARWRAKNPDYAKNYYIENKDELNEQKKRYYRENRESALESCKRYRSENKEAISERQKDYHRRNPMAVSVASNKRRARILGAGGSFTKEEVGELFFRQKGRCALCPARLVKTGKEKFHADHIQPISKGGSNFISNIQLTCPECNRSKGAKDPFEFAKEKGKLL